MNSLTGQLRYFGNIIQQNAKFREFHGLVVPDVRHTVVFPVSS